jgi:hypothetical protein
MSNLMYTREMKIATAQAFVKALEIAKEPVPVEVLNCADGLAFSMFDFGDMFFNFLYDLDEEMRDKILTEEVCTKEWWDTFSEIWLRSIRVRKEHEKRDEDLLIAEAKENETLNNILLKLNEDERVFIRNLISNLEESYSYGPIG